MELSKRLQAVADMATSGLTLADVGCDHGYISIYLTERDICPKVIAMDVNEGPLMRAKEHVQGYEAELPIELRLSDGLKELKSGEVQSIIIAGMGGGLIMKILNDRMDLVSELKECILQPQSEIYKVRAFLIQKGFSFAEEDMVLEDGKFYPMMKVLPSKQEERIWSSYDLQFGKLLLEKKNQTLLAYLKREKAMKEQILRSLKEQKGNNILTRIQELEEELLLVNQALLYYD